MSPDKQNLPPTERGDRETSAFVGEEDIGARSSPEKDMLAAAIIGLFAIIAMYFAFDLPVTKNVLTTPALLPVLTSLTLLAMAVGLGVKAVRAGASIPRIDRFLGSLRHGFAGRETHRTVILTATIVVYVIGIDLFAFELRLPTPFFVFAFSGYELLSGITLTFLLKYFWGAGIAPCLLVAFGWAIILASIFRYGFNILLPGLG